MLYGVYQVTGRRQYRGHEPGTTFEAIINPAAEQRAIARGDIKLLRRVKPSLVPGSYRLPDGWLEEPAPQANERRLEGASLISEEGRR